MSSTSDSRGPLGIAAIALAATLWAIAAVVARRLFDRGVEPLELVQARAVISAAGLALVPAAWRGRSGGRPWTVIALGLSIALVNAFYYLALERLDVAVALVLQYTGPAIVVAWVAISVRRAPSKGILIALAGAFLGVVLVSEALGADIAGLDALGIGFGIGSAFMFATYTLLSEKAGEAYGIVGALFRGFVAASVMWIAFQIPRGWPSSLTTGENLPSVLFVGVVGTLLPFLLYVWGVERVRAERAVIAATLEPVVAGIVAWVWLDQLLSALQLVGAALILTAVLSLQLKRPHAVPNPD